VTFWRLFRGCLTLHVGHLSSTKSSGGDGFVLTSVGGSSHPHLTSFVDPEGDEPCGASWLAEADPRLMTMPVFSLGDDHDGDCDAVAGVEGCTYGVGTSCAPVLG